MIRREGVGKALAYVAALAAVWSAFSTSGCGEKAPQRPAPAAPEVAAFTVRAESVVLTTELPGRTVPFLVAEIRPQVGGLIQKRMFREGADVTAGQVLYRIDPASFQAAYDNARAALLRAEANLPALRSRADRYKELVGDRAVSRQDYEDAAAALTQAEADAAYWRASVAAARINLEYTRVTAPISGRIGRSSVTDGALVTANQPVALATIQQLDPIYVDVPQSTAELLRLKIRLKEGRLRPDGADQRKVRLLLDDGTRYPLEGSLEFQEVTVDPSTGSVILRAVFRNPRGLLLPGMFVRAVLKEGVNPHAILVPQQAVSRDPKGNPTALIVDGDGKVQLRMLSIDRAIGDKWLVSSGLAPGDRVIAEGVQKVRPGASVKVVPFDAPPSN